MKAIVELAAASLPWAIRDRYREEWLHDLEHAAEAGVRRGDVARAAVRTAITADRMQAPSMAHAILQARTRIDSAGMHLSIAVMLVLLAHQAMLWGAAAVAALLTAAAIAHLLISVVQLQLAWRVVGGRMRFAIPLLLVGACLMAIVLLPQLSRPLEWWWPFIGVAGMVCLFTSMALIERGKPPKPVLRRHLLPAARRRLLVIGAGIGVLTIVLAALDAAVLVPARWERTLPVADAWSAIAAAGGPPSALAAMGQLMALMLVPVVIGLIGAARWARTERGSLGWTAAGALGGILVAFLHATTLAIMLPVAGGSVSGGAVILPLIAGGLVELAVRQQRDLAPLPPASVPIPPGPWHITLDGEGAPAADR